MTPPFQARRRTGSDDRRTPPLLPGGIQRASGTMRTMRLIRTPSRLYRLLALAEMVTWTLLLLGMLLKYALQVTEVGVRIGGSLHGFVFLSYVVVTVLVAVDQRWSLGRLAMGLGSALVPYLTVPFERWAHRKGMLGDSWRLREDAPRSFPEKVVALALRRPRSGSPDQPGERGQRGLISGSICTLPPPRRCSRPRCVTGVVSARRGTCG